MGFIYCITNQVTGKKYVGQTIHSIEQRFRSHVNKAKTAKNNQQYIIQSMRKYGVSAFIIEALQECRTVDELAIAETHWIQELNTLAPHGYNLILGDRSGPRSEEARRRMSEQQRGKPSGRKGKTYGPNHKLSDKQKGKTPPQFHTPAANAKRKAALLGQPKSHTARKAMSFSKKKLILAEKDGITLCFRGAEDVVAYFGISRRTIQRALFEPHLVKCIKLSYINPLENEKGII
jgi:group I intron endonuclease